ncbi:MAG: hypothetical protein M3R05_03015 [Chloroflexota bacterium]|nr:hypothetical protein [Chloroflexota bacterium]
MKNDRLDDRHPAEGAMTGATGSLTPPESDEEFIPAERREVMGGEEGSARDEQDSDHDSPESNPAGEDQP